MASQMPIDYEKLNTGDIDPTLGKKIDYIIGKTPGYIIYLDDLSAIHWSLGVRAAEQLGGVLNRVCQLETASDFLKGTKHLRPIRTMIAEGLARIFMDHDVKTSSEILDQAERLILLRNREYSRVWFFSSSLISAGVFTVLFLLLIWHREQFLTATSQNAFVVVTTALAAGFRPLRFQVPPADPNLPETCSSLRIILSESQN
jgi:hypothetical protein